MTMIKVGFFQVLPFLGATAGILVAGFLSDFFICRGVSMSTARNTPLIVGSLLASVIVLVNFVTSDALIGILTVAFFAQGIASSSWAAVSEIAPRQYIGLTSGTTSPAANLAGISTPLAIGYVLQATGSFYWALISWESSALSAPFPIRFCSVVCTASRCEPQISANGDISMFQATFDHLQLRSPDPEGTAKWFEQMLGAEIVRAPGRVDIDLATSMCSSLRCGTATTSARRRRRLIRGWIISGSRLKTSSRLSRIEG